MWFGVRLLFFLITPPRRNLAFVCQGVQVSRFVTVCFVDRRGGRCCGRTICPVARGERTLSLGSPYHGYELTITFLRTIFIAIKKIYCSESALYRSKQQKSSLLYVKVNDFFLFMRNKCPEITANETMPQAPVLFLKSFFHLVGNIRLVVLLL